MIRAATLLALCLVLSACQSFYPVRVQVLDAETQKPIPGATVEGDYMMTELSVADVYGELIFGYTAGPKPTSATTDDRGLAVLPLSDYSARTRGARVHADGYLTSAANIAPARFDQIRRDSNRSEATPTNNPPDLIVRLFRPPHFTLQLVIPDGFRGLLRLDSSSPTTTVALPPNPRIVEVPVHPPGPEKLPLYYLGNAHAVTPEHITARYANGTSIPRDEDSPADGAIALRPIGRRDSRAIFLVGNLTEARAARNQIRELSTDFDALWNATPTKPTTRPR